MALSANERIAEFLDFAIQAKFAYVNKLSRFLFCYKNKKALIFIGKIKTNLAMIDKNDTISKGFTEFHSKMKL